MFGGYSIFCDGIVVALVCDNQMFVKPTVKGKKFIDEVEETSPYRGAKPYFLIQDRLDDQVWMCELIRLTAAELPVPTRRKPKMKHA
jgi:TfoX/Sxy family transcriptional regulator of competence genes